MIEAIAAILAWLAAPGDVEQLRATAPTYLTTESARQHLGAARAAALAAGTDAELLLSIAHHESRYSITEQTPEEGGLRSCGVLTPEPKARCSRDDLTLVGGYTAGARHLAVWRRACGGNTRCLLLGYAGGYRLIEMCRRRTLRVCSTPWVFLERARRIGS